MKTAPLAGRIALVTGSSQGIGRAIAERLAGEGAMVAVVASRSMEKAEAVVAGIVATGGAAAAFVADLSGETAAARLVAAVVRRFGGVDILVNAAGIDMKAPVEDVADQDFDALFAINLKAPFFMIKAATPAMAVRGGGHVVNLSSAVAQLPYGERSLYCASKAALSMMTRALAWELGPKGIAINSVAPGNVLTHERAVLLQQPEYAPIVEHYRKLTPGQRVFSTPEDVAAIVSFLVSPAARTLMGAEILCDDGFTCGQSGRIDGDGATMIPTERQEWTDEHHD